MRFRNGVLELTSTESGWSGRPSRSRPSQRALRESRPSRSAYKVPTLKAVKRHPPRSPRWVLRSEIGSPLGYLASREGQHRIIESYTITHMKWTGSGKHLHPSEVTFRNPDGPEEATPPWPRSLKGKIVTARPEAELGPGDFFGEPALLEGGRRYSDASDSHSALGLLETAARRARDRPQNPQGHGPSRTR